MLFEQAVGVGGKHFCPLVAVIAGRVATGENVREVVREPVVRRREYDGDLVTNLVEQLKRCPGTGRIVVVVQPEIEQRELELAHRLKSALEILRREHLVEQRTR